TVIPGLSAARMPWMWPSVSPGITVRPPRSISFAPLPASSFIAAEAPGARILPSPIATACCVEKSLSTVRILPLKRIVSAVWAEATPAGEVTMKAAAKQQESLAEFDLGPGITRSPVIFYVLLLLLRRCTLRNDEAEIVGWASATCPPSLAPLRMDGGHASAF